jgi:hypothetical protein
MTQVAGEERLRLRARGLDDLSVISALVQDALVPVGDIAFIEPEHSFVLALNRFRWEMKVSADARERAHSGLRFDSVNRVRFRGIDRGDRGQFLSLLAIAYDDGIVTLHFAGGGVIRLEVDALNCALEDLAEPWPTLWTPHHDTD